MIEIVNKAHHWRESERCVYVGRPSALGNPFVVDPYGKVGARAEAIEKYEQYILKSMKYPRIAYELTRLKRLADTGDLKLMCWCAPLPCHAEVIRKILLGKYEQVEL